MKIETKRLYLYPLQARELKALIYDLPWLEHMLRLQYRAEPIEGEFLEIMDGQLAATKEDTLHYYWHTFWLLIRKKDQVVVGSADFKDCPDEYGHVEIGYGLGAEFEKHGYMTEAVRAMCNWALAQQGVSHVIAETELTNTRSHAILKRCGFKEWSAGETIWWMR